MLVLIVGSTTHTNHTPIDTVDTIDTRGYPQNLPQPHKSQLDKRDNDRRGQRGPRSTMVSTVHSLPQLRVRLVILGLDEGEEERVEPEEKMGRGRLWQGVMAGRGKGFFLPCLFVSSLLHIISILDPPFIIPPSANSSRADCNKPLSPKGRVSGIWYLSIISRCEFRCLESVWIWVFVCYQAAEILVAV